MKILILDAANYNTLAIVRHLGILNYELHLAGYNHYSISFFSKYCNKKFIIENPGGNEEKFILQLLDILKNEHYDLLMPVGYNTHKACVKFYDDLKKYTSVILPEQESFNTAANKIKSYKLAEKLGIGFPKSFYLKNIDEVGRIDITYPAVIKAQKEMGKNVLDYAHSKKELIDKFRQMFLKNRFDNDNLPVIQEYIIGGGYGFFAYYESGKCQAYFMHKRIREYPATGGASVCAEAIFDQELLRQGKMLLDELKWNGVAMVEFKKDLKDGRYKLMEINPKFWGSLELAMAAGVNFPDYLVQKCKNPQRKIESSYKKIRFHWILNGELYHFFSRPASFLAIFRDLFSAKSDIWWSDIKPNIFQLSIICIDFYKRMRG